MREFSEIELEDYLYRNAKVYYRGDGEFGWCGRQVSVASGIVDLLGLEICDGLSCVHVVELKSEPLKSRHLTQVCRYAADIGSQLPGRHDFVEKVLIGPGDLPAQFLFEADALGVIVRQTGLEIYLCRPWSWGKDQRDRHMAKNARAVAMRLLPKLEELDRQDSVQEQAGGRGDE